MSAIYSNDAERMAMLEALIHGVFTDLERAAVHAVFVEQRSVAAAASDLGVPEWKLAYRLRAARIELRAWIDRGKPDVPADQRPPTPEARSAKRFYAYRGESLTMPQLARKYGVPEGRLRERLKWGWTIEAAIETPPLPVGCGRAAMGRRQALREGMAS